MSRALEALYRFDERQRARRSAEPPADSEGKPQWLRHAAPTAVQIDAPDDLSADERAAYVAAARRQGRLARAAAIAAGFIVPKGKP